MMPSERALSVTQGRLQVIPQDAADEIARHCHLAEMDFAKLESETEHVGYPVLPVVEQLTALCDGGLGQWCHWGATTQDITDTATVPQIRSGLTPVEAIPMTFGYKVAVWLAGLRRQRSV